MPKRESNLNRKLAHTTKPTGGPVAQLETLADAAQLIARPREALPNPVRIGSETAAKMIGTLRDAC